MLQLGWLGTLALPGLAYAESSLLRQLLKPTKLPTLDQLNVCKELIVQRNDSPGWRLNWD